MTEGKGEEKEEKQGFQVIEVYHSCQVAGTILSINDATLSLSLWDAKVRQTDRHTHTHRTRGEERKGKKTDL